LRKLGGKTDKGYFFEVVGLEEGGEERELGFCPGLSLNVRNM